MSAAIVSMANTKGGVGKTTLVRLFGFELVLMGYKVVYFDADPRQRLSRWNATSKLENLTFVANVSEENILPLIEEHQAKADFIIVDLPGMASLVVTYAIARSDLVLLPTNPSGDDLADTIAVDVMVRDAQKLVGSTKKISRRAILTRVPSLKTRATEHSITQLEQRNVPMLETMLMERTAFKEMTFTGIVPSQSDPGSNAAINVRAITDEILQVLRSEGVQFRSPDIMKKAG